MAKKKLQSGLELKGISPNILLKHVESTAPFLFKGEIDTSLPGREYLEKLRFYKKNLKALNHIDLKEYFHICLSAHWATAGTFVPTDVDNQIREGLWKHKDSLKYVEKMAQLTMKAWEWDYTPVTNRKSYNQSNNEVMSTHEGTWLSVAIGAYCALKKYQKEELAKDMADIILKEAKKEEALMLQLREDRDHINFLRAAPLIAHNFGDLDRVMVQWQMDGSDPFFKEVYRLGHDLNEGFSPILVYTGKVNKKFSSKENHRHLSLRIPKCLRKSNDFLIPVGPFFDDWGKSLGLSQILDLSEKAEIVCALFDGFQRQEQAFGYIRGFKNLIEQLDDGIDSLEQFIAFDVLAEIKKSEFYALSKISREEFENYYIKELESFVCPVTNLQF